MQILHRYLVVRPWEPFQQLLLTPMTLTTDRIAAELLEETLLTLEQVSTGATVLAINATRNPEQSRRVRKLLGALVVLILATDKIQLW